MRDRVSVDRSIFRFLRSTWGAKTAFKGPARRKLAFDALEERTLLTAVGWSDVALNDENTLATEVRGADENGAVDRFDIELEVLESGAARYSTQTGVRYSSSTVYCAVPDSIYLELLDRALERWEGVIVQGLPDVEGAPAATGDGDETTRFV
ncbi:MAG: hypothetical protein IKY61_05850, partial [Thermoguttaceae bacterium]|nr:hypothetical protein [Thermoguttaceae bacterium]